MQQPIHAGDRQIIEALSPWAPIRVLHSGNGEMAFTYTVNIHKGLAMESHLMFPSDYTFCRIACRFEHNLSWSLNRYAKFANNWNQNCPSFARLVAEGNGRWTLSGYYPFVSFPGVPETWVPVLIRLFDSAVKDVLRNLAITAVSSIDPAGGDVIDDVDHNEPAANLSNMWADNVQHINQVSNSPDTTQASETERNENDEALDFSAAEPDGEKIHVIEFARDPKEFHQRLGEHTELSQVRDALAKAYGDNAYKPEDGPWVFVHPKHYDAVLQEIQANRDSFRPRHVIVSESIEGTLLKILQDIPSKKGVKPKPNRIVLGAGTTSPETVDHNMEMEGEGIDLEDIPLEYQRTFLCYAPLRRNMDSVSNSTTEAHGGLNPRRALGIVG